jgi:formylmethanofuran dehydrogenase subunit E
MNSHQSHNQSITDGGVVEMSKCQICHEPIWGDQWPSYKEKIMRKFVCFYCYSNLKHGGYKPKLMKKSSLVVCDGCGEVVDNVQETDSGFLCRDCNE